MKSIYRLKGRGPTRERAGDSGARPEDQEKAELREKQSSTGPNTAER